jgi:rubrerythrin
MVQGYECECKIGSVSKAINQPDLPNKIGHQYQNNDLSLRQVAKWFNIEVLKTRLESSGMNLLDGEADNFYRLLTDEEVSQGNNIQMRNKLEKHGINPDELVSQFVSYQTINRHLKNCLNLSTKKENKSNKNRVETARHRLQALENRNEQVVKKTLEELDNTEKFTLTQPEVIINISVVCSKCGTHSQLDELLNNEGCNC